MKTWWWLISKLTYWLRTTTLSALCSKSTNCYLNKIGNKLAFSRIFYSKFSTPCIIDPLKGKSTLEKVFLEMYFFERASKMMTNKKNRRSKALSVPEILTILYFLLWRHWAQKANFIISILWQLDVQPHIFQIKSPIYFRLSQITRHPYYFSQKWKKFKFTNLDAIVTSRWQQVSIWEKMFQGCHFGT